MRSSNTSLPLEDSWGVVSDSANSDQDDFYEEDLFDKRMRAQRKLSSPRANNQPEVIMRSSTDGSRLPSPQHSSGTMKNDESPASRRRSPRTAPIAESPRRRSERNLDKQTRHAAQQPRDEMSSDTSANVSAILSWFFDIFGGAFKALKRPLTIILAGWLLLGIMMLAQNFFMYSLEMALSPLCRIPILSTLNSACPALHTESRDGMPVAFDQAVAAQANFEELMEKASDSNVLQLPREMKAGERLIRDLRQLVAYSEINSKNELAMELDQYIQHSQQTTEGLTKFNSHIGSAVDNIIAVTRWTIRVLDGFQIEQESQGTISGLWDMILAPFQPIKFTEDRLFDQFIDYTKHIENEIIKLLVEAEDLQMQLNLMESSTDTIGGLAYRDEKHASAKKDEIYSWLWTRVGGNRDRIHKINGELDFLRKVTFDRKSAALHINTTILRLLESKSQLENLRTAVANPDLVRESLPLSVHIDTILAGAQRLEDVRQHSRDREMAFIRSPKDKDSKTLLELGSSRTR